MFEYLYEWLKDISYYLILITAIIHVLPSGSYRKYIRFFTGLILILMLLTPVLNLFGDNERAIGNLMKKYNEELEMKRIDFHIEEERLAEKNFNEEMRIEKNRKPQIRIEVEEIVIDP